MLKFPAQRVSPRQHIILPYAKYVVIWAIIIFAAASSHIPALEKFSANSNYRQHIAIISPKKVEAITINSTPIKKTTSIRIVQGSSDATIIIHESPTPQPSPKAHKPLAQQADRPLAEPPTKSSTQTVAPTNTSTPIKSGPIPTKKPTPTATNTPTSILTPQVQSNPPSDARGQLLSALNAYRQKKGKATLSWDDKLGSFAQERAETFDRDGKMDSHAGFRDMLNNNGFGQMGFNALAENSSYGDSRDSVYIIETLYGQSSGHDANQLNSEYTHAGVGASGKATDFVFGGRKR